MTRSSPLVVGRRPPVPLLAVWLVLVLPLARSAAAADPAPADVAALAAREAELLGRYRELERSFLRLADALAATDPRRAAVLRSVFDRAREEQVGDRVATIVSLLEQGQLLKAGASQGDALEQLGELLELLEAGAGDRRLADTKREVRAFLGRITKLIARQRDVEGSTEAGEPAEPLARRQREVEEAAQELGDDVDAFAKRVDDTAEDDAAGDAASPPAPPGGEESRPPGGKAGEQGGEQSDGGGDPESGNENANDSEPEGDDDAARARRTRRRLEAAERRMRAARERLDQAERRDARREQEKAIEELETARAELEEILRQLREQEVERLLVQLETRLRGMLRAERAVLSDAERLAATAEGRSDRERQLEAARLGREQGTITAEAARALTLVRDDGSAVAIPQALELVHDDSAQAAGRLARGDVGRDTTALLGEIVTGLEEMLAAVEKAKQAAKDEAAGGQGGRAGEPGEQPLVDKLAELKMLRTLQLRVNTRTRRFAQLLDDATDQTVGPEIRGVLDRLAERQRAIEQAARDIVSGMTE